MTRKTPEERAAILERQRNKRIDQQIDLAVDDLNYHYPWQRRLQRYRDHLDKLPDQRRRIPIESGWKDKPRNAMERKLHAAGASWKEGPRVSIERAIGEAEKAAEASDLDAFAQALERIVSDFWRAGLPLALEAGKSASQSGAGKAPRPAARSPLTNIIEAIDPDDIGQLIARWKQEPEIEGRQLRFDELADKPFIAGGKAWNRIALQASLSRHLKRKR